MKTKLVIFQYSLANWGGAENIIWKVANYLQHTGMYEIVVVGMVDEQPSFEKDFERIGIRTKCLHVSDKKNILTQIPQLWSLADILKTENPDILFNVLFPSIFSGGIIGTICKVPHIIGNIHGPALFKKKLAIMFDRMVAPLYEGYITVAPHIKERFIAREQIPAEKITVIPNGLEMREVPAGYDRETFRKEQGISRETLVLGTIGRIYPEKNQKYLVSIGKELIKTIPDLKLLIVGDGPRFAELKEFIKAENMEQHCVLPGWRSDTVNFLKTMDMFVLPSHYEGMPCSILEAWQQYVPVAGTNVPGIRDLLTEGKTGIILPPNDAKEAAKVLEKKLKDAAALQKIAEQAFTTWKTQYTVETMAKAHHQYFQKLLEK